jgi:hypothetical protein
VTIYSGFARRCDGCSGCGHYLSRVARALPQPEPDSRNLFLLEYRKGEFNTTLNGAVEILPPTARPRAFWSTIPPLLFKLKSTRPRRRQSESSSAASSLSHPPRPPFPGSEPKDHPIFIIWFPKCPTPIQFDQFPRALFDHSSGGLGLDSACVSAGNTQSQLNS